MNDPIALTRVLSQRCCRDALGWPIDL